MSVSAKSTVLTELSRHSEDATGPQASKIWAEPERPPCALVQDVAIQDLSSQKRTFFSAIPAKENDYDLLTF